MIHLARPEQEIVEERRVFMESILECAKTPSEFSKRFLNHDLFDYNKKYVDCDERFIIYRSGRQVGKTMSTAVKAIHFAFFAPMMSETVKNECTILIAAPTQDQAAIMFDRIRGLITSNEFLKGYIVRSTRTEIWVSWFDHSGVSRIVTRATGDKGISLRGYTPHVIIADECSFIAREVMVAFLPSGLATKVHVWLTSTPFSKNSYFYEKHLDSRPNNPDGVWIEFHVKSTQNPLIAADPLWLAEIKAMAKEKYIMEVEGEFLDIGDSLIPHSLLMDALNSQKTMPEDVRYYLGVDIARLGADETVFTVIAVDRNDYVYVLESINEKQSNIVDIVGRIKNEFMGRYPIETIFMDETGLGAGAVDLSRVQDLPTRGIVFSLTEKSLMFGNLRMLFENHRVQIRANNTALVRQLGLLRREYTEEGKLKVKTEEGVNDDYADSFALACKAIAFGDTWHVMPVGKGLKHLFG